MMKLYYTPNTCSLSPHIVLREAGLDFELVRVDLSKHLLPDGGDFGRINPKGYVPALELDDGRVLTEGTAIVQYLADLKPSTGLAPAYGSFERYRLNEWLAYLNSEVHKGFSPLFKPGVSEDYKRAAKAALENRFLYIAEHLKKSAYLLGETFSVADAYLFTITGWCAFAGVDLSAWPSLLAFRERVGSRPAVKAALEAEAKKN